MKNHGRRVLVACLIGSFGISAAAQTPGMSAADTKELNSYRLTMENVKKAHVAMRTLFEEMRKDPKYQALMKLNAEIEALEKKEELTDAEAERLSTLQQQKEQQEDALDAGVNMSNAKTIDDMEAQIKSHPPMVRALTQAGMTPREYSKFMMTMLMSAMVAGFQKSGLVKELPKDLQAIHPDNVKFVIEHEAELKAMQEELSRLGRQSR